MESDPIVSSYPSLPRFAAPVKRSTIAPGGAEPSFAVTGSWNPVARRSLTAIDSATRIASALAADTTTDDAAVRVNGAPVPGATDAGVGTTPCAASEASGGSRSVTGRVGFGVG